MSKIVNIDDALKEQRLHYFYSKMFYLVFESDKHVQKVSI